MPLQDITVTYGSPVRRSVTFVAGETAGPLNLALKGVDCHVMRNGLGTAGLYA